ncbi:MAG: hypothetical protein QNK23_10155 [Crocinitomicaceae bacterium]|nr:hypothetical protein [Crocinitomicaceae bacterium]
MENKQKLLFANILRAFARFGLLVIGLLLFGFALISGSEELGGGFMGIVKNSPNALPWLVILVLVFIAWKWEFVGGVLITTVGLLLFIFFNLMGPNFFLVTAIFTGTIVLFGTFFILSWYLRKSKP